MASFRESIITVVLISIFAFALFGFGINFAVSNSDTSILENSVINNTYSDIQTELDDVYKKSTEQKAAWYEDVPIIKEINLVWKSLTGILRVFFDVITGGYNIFIELISTVLGIPTIILNGIAAIITISMLLLLWRTVRSGS